jgi:hypothetical protein
LQVSCSSDPKASLIIGEMIPLRTAPPKSLGRSLLAEHVPHLLSTNFSSISAIFALFRQF